LGVAVWLLAKVGTVLVMIAEALIGWSGVRRDVAGH
jgi:hypothetical protein